MTVLQAVGDAPKSVDGVGVILVVTVQHSTNVQQRLLEATITAHPHTHSMLRVFDCEAFFTLLLMSMPIYPSDAAPRSR